MPGFDELPSGLSLRVEDSRVAVFAADVGKLLAFPVSEFFVDGQASSSPHEV